MTQQTPKGAWPVAVVRLHAGQLRRQGGGRTGGGADHEGAEPDAEAVRAARIGFLPAVLRLRRDRGLRRQPPAHEMDPADPGVVLGRGAVPDAVPGRVRHAARVPRAAGRRRRPRGRGRHARGLQVVPGREADAADGVPVTGGGVRRDRRVAGAELAHRPRLLALGVRSTRDCRPDLGGGLVLHRRRGTAVGRPGDGPRRRAGAVLQAAAEPHLHRLHAGLLRRLLVPLARAHLVHAVHRERPRLLPAERRLARDPALGDRRDHGHHRRGRLAGAGRPRREHPQRARCSGRCR